MIPLCSDKTKSLPVIVRRGPVLQKDPKPLLTNFLENEETKNQFYIPEYDKSSNNKFVSMTKPLHLYNILQIIDSWVNRLASKLQKIYFKLEAIHKNVISKNWTLLLQLIISNLNQ